MVEVKQDDSEILARFMRHMYDVLNRTHLDASTATSFVHRVNHQRNPSCAECIILSELIGALNLFITMKIQQRQFEESH